MGVIYVSGHNFTQKLKALVRGCNFIKGFKSTNRILTITNTSHESIPPLCKLINIDHWPITSKIRAWDLPGNWDRSLLKFVKVFKSVLWVFEA